MAGKPDKDALSAALRANLRRRKAAARKPASATKAKADEPPSSPEIKPTDTSK